MVVARENHYRSVAEIIGDAVKALLLMAALGITERRMQSCMPWSGSYWDNLGE